MASWYLFLMVLTLKSAAALIIEYPISQAHTLLEDSFKQVFHHMRAQFGSQAEVLSRLPLVVLKSRACSKLNYTELSNKVVLTMRSSYSECDFVTKARNAQDAGARGIIIANCPPNEASKCNTNGLLIMTGKDSEDIEIPSIFVSYQTYTSIEEMWNSFHSQQPANDHSLLLATIDRTNEIPNDRSLFRPPTVDMTIPIAIALLLSIVYIWLRLRLRERSRILRMRDQGAVHPERLGGHQHASSLQIITFSRKIASPPGSDDPLLDSGEIHNDNCAICLEEFRIGSPVKLLPCHHGYHSGCIDPWLRDNSELCPICKQSIYVADRADPLDEHDTESDQAQLVGPRPIRSDNPI